MTTSAGSLNRECPTRPTLFEFFLNGPLYEKLAGYPMPDAATNRDAYNQFMIDAFQAAGYDYATIHPPAGVGFPVNDIDNDKSLSANDYNSIRNREDFNNYPWPDPGKCDYSPYERMKLPEGMKAIICGPGGVLENVIRLVGYDAMCIMTIEDPELLKDIFANVGGILARHYELASQFDTVGALMSNDDWGFNTQTMLSPADFETYLFPWHRKIAAAGHKAGQTGDSSLLRQPRKSDGCHHR